MSRHRDQKRTILRAEVKEKVLLYGTQTVLDGYGTVLVAVGLYRDLCIRIGLHDIFWYLLVTMP